MEACSKKVSEQVFHGFLVAVRLKFFGISCYVRVLSLVRPNVVKQPKPAIVVCFSGGADGSSLVVLGGLGSKLFGGRGSQ